ncbi:RING-type E3 ubiquitin transferase [Sarracenia purpurea var. burkii]
MSDEVERTCPLCAEEMDLTDQQLKPCKCGYEICVWCWHHILEMAEKDETEGRCPACRTPYNKEKTVGMTGKCERLVAEMNMEKKVKSQKAKSKTSDGRKHLTSVRVIQRNLVYIVGLPLNLADEDLLQCKDYFGQYGKVLKVSISRTASGSIQHFANNTCSVYITYSKEEEAVRCIQSVHGFVLDGRSLRACFGTTKYCHAWLRNVPCSNLDCLYLHEIGSQEDSFTKDEIISAYTRSRVQQITGATNSMQRRSGNVLPPPADEYYINSSASSGKPISKSASNNAASTVKGSPPKSSSFQSVALPAAAAAAASWENCLSNCRPTSTSLVCSNGPLKQKPETCGSMAFSVAVYGTARVPLLNDDVQKKLIPCETGLTILHQDKQDPLDLFRQYAVTDRQTTVSEAPATSGLPAPSTIKGQLHSPPTLEDKDRCISVASNNTNYFDISARSYGHDSDKDLNVSSIGNLQNLCSDMATINIDKCHGDEQSGDDNTLVNSPRDQRLKQCYPEQFREPPISHSLGNVMASTDDIYVTKERSDRISFTREQSDWRLDSQTQVANTDSQVAFPEVEEDLRYFEDQRLNDPEVVSRTSTFTNSSSSFHISNISRIYSPQQNEPYGPTSVNLDPQILDKKVDKVSLLHPAGVKKVLNGFPEDIISSSVDSEGTVDNSYLLPIEVKKKHVGRYVSAVASSGQIAGTDMGESSIISNILSMDIDAWDESLTSPKNLAKLLGETDRQEGSTKLSNSRKIPNNSQSRFSFARQEETRNQISDLEPSFSNFGQVLKGPLGQDYPKNRDFSFDKLGESNGFSAFNIENSDKFASSHSHVSSNKLSVSRAQISAPPGFSVPSRAPPPGFASQERMEPTFDSMSGIHFLDPSSLRNPNQAPTGNIGSVGDIEFWDPAILAVGKGRPPAGLNNTLGSGLEMRSNFPPQLSSFENESRLQFLMQRSLPPLQNQRFVDTGSGFSLPSDTYRIPSRILEQQLHSGNISPFSQLSLQHSGTAPMLNGQWDSWNEVQSGNDVGMAEVLRTEILGLDNLYTGREDSKFRMPSSSDLYNRRYGI